MLSKYDLSTSQSKKNAIYEISQQITLLGLANGGFFDKAAFYGGTCLRLFHGLNRFSEDMDFSLLRKDLTDFNFEDYFPHIIDAFKLLGRNIEISKKNKEHFSKIESAFLKDNTDVYDISFSTEKSIRIKIELDTDPPINFETEQKLMLLPLSTMINCYKLEDLFAGKMHALIYRSWKNRVKGRDWYDFEWYIKHAIPLNFKHLQARIKQFNNKDINKDEFIHILNTKLSTTDIDMVKADVKAFIRDEKAMDIWSNSYFKELAKNLIIKE